MAERRSDEWDEWTPARIKPIGEVGDRRWLIWLVKRADPIEVVAASPGSREQPAGLREAAQAFLDAYVDSRGAMPPNDPDALAEAEHTLRAALAASPEEGEQA